MKEEYFDLNNKDVWGKVGKGAYDIAEGAASFFGLGEVWNSLVKDILNWFGVGDKTFPNSAAVIKFVKDSILKIKQKDAVLANQFNNRLQNLPLPKSTNTKQLIGIARKDLNDKLNKLSKKDTALATAEESALNQANTIDFAKATNRAKVANQITSDFEKAISKVDQ